MLAVHHRLAKVKVSVFAISLPSAELLKSKLNQTEPDMEQRWIQIWERK